MNVSSLERHLLYYPFKEPLSHHLTRAVTSTTAGSAYLIVAYKAIPTIATAVSTIALPHLLATGALLSTAAHLSSGRTLSRRMTSYAFSTASGATLAITLLVHATALPWFLLLAGTAAISLKASTTEREQNSRITRIIRSEQWLHATIDTYLYKSSCDISDEHLLFLGKRALNTASSSTQELGLKLLLALTSENPQAIATYAQELLGQEKHWDVALKLLTHLVDANYAGACIQNIEAVAQNEETPLALRLRLYTILIKNSAKYDIDALKFVKRARPQDEKTAEAKAFLLVGLVTKASPLTRISHAHGKKRDAARFDQIFDIAKSPYPQDIGDERNRKGDRTDADGLSRECGLTARQRKSLLIAASDAAHSIIIPYSINSRYKLCQALITEDFQGHQGQLRWIAQKETTPIELQLRLYTLLVTHASDYNDEALSLAKSANAQDAEAAEDRNALLAELINKLHTDAFPTGYEAAIDATYSVDSRYKLCKALLKADPDAYIQKIALIAQNKNNPIELRLRLYTLLVTHAPNHNNDAFSLAKCANAQGANVESRYKLCKALLKADPDAYIQKIALIAQNKNNSIELRLRLYILLTKRTKSYQHEAFALANHTNALDTKIKKARGRLLKKIRRVI